MKKNLLVILVFFLWSLSMYGYNSKLEEKLFYNQGFFGASFLYQTYFCNGMTSDAWTNKAYTTENAKSILQANKNLLEISIKTLNELALFSITTEDRNTLIQMVDIASDLNNQASFMISYIDSQNQEDLKQYNIYRKSAWDKIKTLMDIK
jgi:hypothetical protein